MHSVSSRYVHPPGWVVAEATVKAMLTSLRRIEADQFSDSDTESTSAQLADLLSRINNSHCFS